jgi:hypothetical protein
MTKYRQFKIRLRWNSKGELCFIPKWLISQKTGLYRDLGSYTSFEGAMARLFTYRAMRFSLAIAKDVAHEKH